MSGTPAPIAGPLNTPLTWQLGGSYFLFLLGSFYAFLPHSWHMAVESWFGLSNAVPHNIHVLFGLSCLALSLWLINTYGFSISAYIADMRRFEIIGAAVSISIILNLLFAKLNPAFMMPMDLQSITNPLILGTVAAYWSYEYVAVNMPSASNLVLLPVAAISAVLLDMIPMILAGGMSVQSVIMAFIFQTVMVLLPLAALFEYLGL